MPLPTPLPPEALYHACSLATLPFATTAELPATAEVIIGQPRAVEAIRFGIGIQHEGYNLFALGRNGVGKATAVTHFLHRKAEQEPTPDDWCYVNNFSQTHQPRTLRLAAGQAAVFAQTIKKLVADLQTSLMAAFSSEEHQRQRTTLQQQLAQREGQVLEEVKRQAKAQNIAVIHTPQGVAFAPLRHGEVVGPDEFMKMEPAEQEAIEQVVKTLQQTLQEMLRQMPQWHLEAEQALQELSQNTALYAIQPLFDKVRQSYGRQEAVLAHLEGMQADVLENVVLFLRSQEEESDEESQKASLQRYQINVLVDHSQTRGAPVVYEDLPTHANLIGRMEHISHMGTLLTDFTLIHAGALHKANWGYLVVDARKLLLQNHAWEGLKQALRAGEIRIESLGQIYSMVSTVSLEPEPIPLKVKVVLMGERELYYTLAQFDPDFEELFKVAADFEDEMMRDDGTELEYAQLMAGLVRKEQLRHLDQAAVGRIIEHSARLAGDAHKLTTHIHSIRNTLHESDYWAAEAGREIITRADVEQAIAAREYRASRVRERSLEAITEGQILIDTQGEVIGQINGLAVLQLDDYRFGRPNRITARVRLGKGEVVDIERQVEMGGPIHSKGVMILAGYVGAQYAAERPLALSATLVFEQSYGGVEGDSASSAELYALVSALAELPLAQGLAVTGSVNQHGQVQVIGGVNEKIEGFFDVCRAQGLTGTQGVLIPAGNVRHLMLNPEVVAAVAAGQFHIYPIRHVDEGLALLMGRPAAEIHALVVARLERLLEQQKEREGK
ncbi:MAG: AAA family ATPase [Chloroflexi bacterium]|nr:AAA family ATPase [Chloroflexota bacterium]